MPASQALLAVPHRRFDQPQLITVCGKRGSGKTWWIQHWLQSCEPRVLIIDAFDRDFPGVRRRVEYQAAIDEFRQTADDARPDRYPPLRRRVVPTWGAGGNCQDWATEFLDALVAACPPGAPPINLRLVVDELSLYIRMNIRSTAFETLVLQGRRMGISLVVATQRTARVPIEMRSEITNFVMFNASLKRDLETYEDFGWPDAESEAPTLKRGECYVVDAGMPE